MGFERRQHDAPLYTSGVVEAVQHRLPEVLPSRGRHPWKQDYATSILGRIYATASAAATCVLVRWTCA